MGWLASDDDGAVSGPASTDVSTDTSPERPQVVERFDIDQKHAATQTNDSASLFVKVTQTEDSIPPGISATCLMFKTPLTSSAWP